MALDEWNIAFIIAKIKEERILKNTLTLARQAYLGDRGKLLKRVLTCYKPDHNHEEFLKYFDDVNNDLGAGFSTIEPLLYYLGAETIDSIDNSDYEKATIIHDMNMPVPQHLKNRFTCIIDGLTLEHVFNFPQAMRNIADMLQIGGVYFINLPANNFLNHGFYQFSPELFYSLFQPKNGFDETDICLINDRFDIYHVKNPAEINERTEFQCYGKFSNTLCFLIGSTRKIAPAPLQFDVQQYDYTLHWENAFSPDANRGSRFGLVNKLLSLSFIDNLYKKVKMPLYKNKLINSAYYSYFARQTAKKYLTRTNLFKLISGK